MLILQCILVILGAMAIALLTTIIIPFTIGPAIRIDLIFIGMMILLYRRKPGWALFYVLVCSLFLDYYVSYAHGVILLVSWCTYIISANVVEHIDITYRWTRIVSIIFLSVCAIIIQVLLPWTIMHVIGPQFLPPLHGTLFFWLILQAIATALILMTACEMTWRQS